MQHSNAICRAREKGQNFCQQSLDCMARGIYETQVSLMGKMLCIIVQSCSLKIRLDTSHFEGGGIGELYSHLK